ncbi:acylphosphatase [Ranunculus cassubicifolius]
MAAANTPSLLHRPILSINKIFPSFQPTKFFTNHHRLSISMNTNNPTPFKTTAGSNSDPVPVPVPPTKTVRVVIKGRVQGVFYRNWTIENANGLGINGWVRNRRDGSVEALFSGDQDLVQEMEQRCRRGPPDAMVTGFQVYPCDEIPGQGFHRKPTV